MVELDHVRAVFEREVLAQRRSRNSWVLGAGFVGVTLGVAVLSGTSGYVPLTLALLTPLEFLVPILATALGYRAVLADRERGEMAILQTYPVSRESYIVGVYGGLLAVLVLIVVGSLALTGLVVPILRPSPAVLSQAGGLDSPVYYVRFVVLTVGFGAVVLAIMVLLSALARHGKRGLVIAIAGLVTLTVGFDLVLVLGLAMGVFQGAVFALSLALSPVSAYRGLVLTAVVGPVVTTPVQAASQPASIVSLLVWWIGSLWLASWQVWRSPAHIQRDQ